jgi:hypothetical protein
MKSFTEREKAFEAAGNPRSLGLRPSTLGRHPESRRSRAGDGASIADSDGARDDGSSTDAEWFCRSERRIAQECRTTVSGAISLSASACGRTAWPLCAGVLVSLAAATFLPNVVVAAG